MTGPSDVSHVRWIGGGTGAGKSTVARLLAERYRLRIYDGDAAEAN
ncbi:shikimate kinase [Glycomyces sp. NRRL B-16210]|nr:shikimate kinase [Glycomyces sp. NRRL B-16210]